MDYYKNLCELCPVTLIDNLASLQRDFVLDTLINSYYRELSDSANAFYFLFCEKTVSAAMKIFRA